MDFSHTAATQPQFVQRSYYQQHSTGRYHFLLCPLLSVEWHKISDQKKKVFVFKTNLALLATFDFFLHWTTKMQHVGVSRAVVTVNKVVYGKPYVQAVLHQVKSRNSQVKTPVPCYSSGQCHCWFRKFRSNIDSENATSSSEYWQQK